MLQGGIIISIEAFGGFVSGGSHQNNSRSNTMPTSVIVAQQGAANVVAGAGSEERRELTEQEKNKRNEMIARQKLRLGRGMPEFKTLAGFFTRTQLFSDMKYRANKGSILQEDLKQRILKSVHLNPEDVGTERGVTIWTTIEALVGVTLSLAGGTLFSME